MECPDCHREMELTDTTYSNYDSGRCYKGKHTGDIYRCEDCEQTYLYSYIRERLEDWSYELPCFL
jgi:hypothetical protein